MWSIIAKTSSFPYISIRCRFSEFAEFSVKIYGIKEINNNNGEIINDSGVTNNENN
jgi:hypothetical protein